MFALNGALHDAAIAAWNHKGVYDSSRPISFIRYMGQLGQSSEPNGPSYNPERSAFGARVGGSNNSAKQRHLASDTKSWQAMREKSLSVPGRVRSTA